MTLREEVVNLSEDRLDEDLITVAGLAVLATALGLSAAAGIEAIVNKIKSKNWEKAEKVQALEKQAWRDSGNVVTGFDVTKDHFKTFVIPSEDFIMKFARKRIVVAAALKKVFILDDFGFKEFKEELKSILVKRYKELLSNLNLPRDEKIKKLLEKKLSVEFYCRGIVALTKEQKKEIEETIKSAVREAGLERFKFKMFSETYR